MSRLSRPRGWATPHIPARRAAARVIGSVHFFASDLRKASQRALFALSLLKGHLRRAESLPRQAQDERKFRLRTQGNQVLRQSYFNHFTLRLPHVRA